MCFPRVRVCFEKGWRYSYRCPMKPRQGDDRDPHRTQPVSPSAVCPKKHPKTPNWPEYSERDISLLSVDEKPSTLWSEQIKDKRQVKWKLLHGWRYCFLWNLFYFWWRLKLKTTSLTSSIFLKKSARRYKYSKLCIICKSPDIRRYSGACSGAAVSLRIVENSRDLRTNVSQSRKVISEIRFHCTSGYFQNVLLMLTLG